MKKRLIILLCAFLAAVSCTGLKNSNPYRGRIYDFVVSLEFPSGYEKFDNAGVPVKVTDINKGYSYSVQTNINSQAIFHLPEGLYRVSAQNQVGEDIFNSSVDRVLIQDNASLSMQLVHSVMGKLVIKEIYCGGCYKLPQQGTYTLDQYIIIHNNYNRVQYLDSVCFGTMAPYNSNVHSPYGDPLPEYLPIVQAVWQFPGNGTSFPLEPGQDAVVCVHGAIDHKAQYPLSVNLNKEGYFVCYNPVSFSSPEHNPVPGSNIREDHWLSVVIKLGIAKAYTFSINSPTAVLFKAPEGMSMLEYIQQEGTIEQLPGNKNDRVCKVYPKDVLDAVEVFNGSASVNYKRVPSSLDAGYVVQSGIYLSHTLMRNVDEEQSRIRGYEVLVDTNNSSVDFYERQTQSLNE